MHLSADGKDDAVEGIQDANGDGVPDYIDNRELDQDKDGIPDAVEGSADTDGDGIPNNLDPDSDNDGIPDVVETAADADGDGVPNYLDLDSDGDGIPDSLEGQKDSDGDGIANYLDLDSDGDGVPDAKEGPTSDADKDGVPDFLDPDTPSQDTTPPVVVVPPGGPSAAADNDDGGLDLEDPFDDADDGIPLLFLLLLLCCFLLCCLAFCWYRRRRGLLVNTQVQQSKLLVTIICGRHILPPNTTKDLYVSVAFNGVVLRTSTIRKSDPNPDWNKRAGETLIFDLNDALKFGPLWEQLTITCFALPPKEARRQNDEVVGACYNIPLAPDRLQDHDLNELGGKTRTDNAWRWIQWLPLRPVEDGEHVTNTLPEGTPPLKTVPKGPEPPFTSSQPKFVDGRGTRADPFVLQPLIVGYGKHIESLEAISITDMDPHRQIPIVDLQTASTQGRFDMALLQADDHGCVHFRFVFSDARQPSEDGTEYHALLRVGEECVYFKWHIVIMKHLVAPSRDFGALSRFGGMMTEARARVAQRQYADGVHQYDQALALFPDNEKCRTERDAAERLRQEELRLCETVLRFHFSLELMILYERAVLNC
eukprot:COSAG01_NODE_89_length_27311_cov_22.687061_8_plen_594_part_00